MALLKYGSRRGTIYFFECISKPNHYFITENDETGGEEWYKRFNRIDSYHISTLDPEEVAKGIDYGYPKLDVKMPVQIEVGRDASSFKSYLLEKFAGQYVAETDMEKTRGHEISNYGWFKIEQLELEKWLNDFYDFQDQKRQEFRKAEGDGIQLSLF
ncbi:MAG: hypothetical protein Q8N83_05820 [Ignavibacteria bacterium]|nr:hypothetical protein [Ignavibacteria bacterium]